MNDLDRVVAAVLAARKYRAVCTDAVRRIATHALAHHGDVKAAVKATKRRLHQVYGAFEKELDPDAAYRRLAAAYTSGLRDEIEAACRWVMGHHRSTRERLPILDGFFPALFAVTGRPPSILDLGCGLNPLALPWMGLPQGAHYIALDIDAGHARFLNRFLALAGLEPLARCQDLLTAPPGDEAAVALLLKTGPTLERQEAGSTERLVEHVRAPFVVVSYAVRTLGGRDKGLEAAYRRQFEELAARRGWHVQRLSFETELAFVVGPRAG